MARPVERPRRARVRPAPPIPRRHLPNARRWRACRAQGGRQPTRGERFTGARDEGTSAENRLASPDRQHTDGCRNRPRRGRKAVRAESPGQIASRSRYSLPMTRSSRRSRPPGIIPADRRRQSHWFRSGPFVAGEVDIRRRGSPPRSRGRLAEACGFAHPPTGLLAGTEETMAIAAPGLARRGGRGTPTRAVAFRHGAAVLGCAGENAAKRCARPDDRRGLLHSCSTIPPAKGGTTPARVRRTCGVLRLQTRPTPAPRPGRTDSIALAWRLPCIGRQGDGAAIVSVAPGFSLHPADHSPAQGQAHDQGQQPSGRSGRTTGAPGSVSGRSAPRRRLRGTGGSAADGGRLGRR